MAGPTFLTLKTGCDEARWAEAIGAARGTVLACAPRYAVTPLEPGTRHCGLVIARFAFAEDRQLFWDSASVLASADDELVALTCNGIAWEGWPGHFVPTIATVIVPDAEARRTFMVIEGT
ncbi:MAG: hypothetical protein ABIP07_05440, partial [Sphingomicrobium sp.]